MLEGSREAGTDLLDRLNSALGDRDHAQDHGDRREVLEQCQVTGPVGVLERHRIERRAVDRRRQAPVALQVGLGIILPVERVRIAAAHVHDPFDALGHTVAAAVQVLDAVVERGLGLARQDRLVVLDPGAASLGERQGLAQACEIFFELYRGQKQGRAVTDGQLLRVANYFASNASYNHQFDNWPKNWLRVVQ